MQRMGLTVTGYAAHAGISRQAVHKAERAGYIVRLPDRSIDAVESDRRRFLLQSWTRGGKPERAT